MFHIYSLPVARPDRFGKILTIDLVIEKNLNDTEIWFRANGRWDDAQTPNFVRGYSIYETRKCNTDASTLGSLY